MVNKTQPEDLPYTLDPDSNSTVANTKTARSIEEQSGRGSSRSSLSNLFTGFNHRMAPLYAPKNTDSVGYTFFTRPDLNFNKQNLNNSRKLIEVLRAGRSSQSAAIIGMLDPENEIMALDPAHCKLGSPFHSKVQFDNRMAFIPLLSNLLVSLTGFPDSTLDVWTSDEGLVREQVSYVDSILEINNRYALSASFRNIEGDPITTFLNFYLDYISGVRRGWYQPRTANILQRRVDYQMRVYRFIMDPTRRYIRKYGIANAVFPVNDTMGAVMNINGNSPLVSDNDQINVQFEAIGAYYNDPIILQEFNDTVAMFNTDMLPLYDSGTSFVPRGKDSMMLIDRSEIALFNYRGFPHIDTNSYEISWYVYTDEYKEVMKGIK